jgi:chemotaxis protein MotB
MRRKKSGDHVNQERWLVSYADFVTLLFAFFTTMYAISTVDAQKLGRMVLSMRASFDNSVFPTGSGSLSITKGEGASNALSRDLVEHVQTPKEKALKEYTVGNLRDLKANFVANSLPQGEMLTLGRLKEGVDALVKSRGIGNKVRTRLETRGLVISLDGSFFDSGSDQLRPEGVELLNSLAPPILSLGSDVRIEGHTDNVPIQRGRFPSNWELSTARATTVVAYLVHQFGFSPEKLSGAGYGEFRPIESNDTPEGRARNRRVDIVILTSTSARGEPR